MRNLAHFSTRAKLKRRFGQTIRRRLQADRASQLIWLALDWRGQFASSTAKQPAKFKQPINTIGRIKSNQIKSNQIELQLQLQLKLHPIQFVLIWFGFSCANCCAVCKPRNSIIAALLNCACKLACAKSVPNVRASQRATWIRVGWRASGRGARAAALAIGVARLG